MPGLTVVCSASGCKWRSDGGYYGICKHPRNMNRPQYGGIDRELVSECKLKEKKMKKKSSFGLFIMWFVIGLTIICLPIEVTKFQYGCVWACYLIDKLIEAFVGDYATGYNEAVEMCVGVIDTHIKELEEKKNNG